MIKTYNGNKNISGHFLKSARESIKMTKEDLCKKLSLCGVNISRDELYKIENNKLMIKDFELIAISKQLDIDLNNLKDYLED